MLPVNTSEEENKVNNKNEDILLLSRARFYQVCLQKGLEHKLQ